VKDDVKAEQDLIDKMDNRKDCHKAGDEVIAKAEDDLKNAKKARDDAKQAEEDAESKKINLGKFTFATLEDIVDAGSCDNKVIKASEYSDHTPAVSAAREDHQLKVGEVGEAEKALEQAKEEAARMVKSCNCKVVQEHGAALEAANSKMAEANKKAWTQAAHIRCVVAGTKLDACGVGDVPVVKAAQLAEGVTCENVSNCPAGYFEDAGNQKGGATFQGAKSLENCAASCTDQEECVGFESKLSTNWDCYTFNTKHLEGTQVSGWRTCLKQHY